MPVNIADKKCWHSKSCYSSVYLLVCTEHESKKCRFQQTRAGSDSGLISTATVCVLSTAGPSVLCALQGLLPYGGLGAPPLQTANHPGPSCWKAVPSAMKITPKLHLCYLVSKKHWAQKAGTKSRFGSLILKVHVTDICTKTVFFRKLYVKPVTQ